MRTAAPAYEAYFPLLISVIALAISLVSAFKNELFDFKLLAVPGEIALLGSGNPADKTFSIIQSIIFINQGYGHGVVEAFVLKIHGPGGVKLYTPFAEIDFQKFIQIRKPLHAEHFRGALGPIVLGSKEATQKFALFTQEKNHAKYPYTEWSPGKYRFELWVTTAGSKTPQAFDAREWDVTQQTIDSSIRGETAIFMDHRIDV